MNNELNIIENFNDNHKIADVIETVTGTIINKKSFCCPLHGGRKNYGASINKGKNIFSCWSDNCGRGLTPWNFIKKYYELNNFKDVAIKCNELFYTNIPIYEKGKKADTEEKEPYNTFKVNKYLSECNSEIKKILDEKGKILLKGNTGIGKTRGIIELIKDLPCDYTFFLAPSRSIVDQVAEKYNFNRFYGNDTKLPNNKYIVATYHKVKAIIRELENINEYRALLREPPINYNVVCDEIHEIMNKRNLYKDFIRDLESFIINSDAHICMSADIEHIEKAYKETELFNDIIEVKQLEKKYNCDNTYIYRISNKPKERNFIIIDKIIEMLGSHTRVIIYEDSIKNLEGYKQFLDDEQIPSTIINSKNKDSEEDAQKEYENIVKNSKLKNLVVLTTSMINAGVNLENNNVCSIAIQNKMQFDSLKIKQFFGRVRTEKDNTCILFLNQIEPNKSLISFDFIFNYYKKDIKNKVEYLNNYYFNKYGIEIIETKIKHDWELYSKNEDYIKIKDCIYIENSIFKVDQVAIYELARKETERANYWSNDYIKGSLKDLKTKNPIQFATIENSRTLKAEPIQKDIEFKFEDLLQDVNNNNDASIELFRYCKGEIKSKEFKTDELKTFYEEFRSSKKYKELIPTLKTLFKVLNDLENSISITECFYDLLEVYIQDVKKKERENKINSIKREHIYNKQFPLGTSNSKILVCGDIIYYIVRKNCDCFINHRNKPSDRAYESMINEYIKYKYKDSYELNGEWYNKEDKKIKPKGIKALFDKCIEHIYNCSKDFKIYSLK